MATSMKTNEEYNNKLEEPAVAYGAVESLTKVTEHIRRLARESEAKDWTDNPEPYTMEELRARIIVAQAEIDAGACGLTTNEFREKIEKDLPWLQKYL